MLVSTEVTEGWRRLQAEELHNWYSLPDVIMIITYGG
jgi:hypothetical protein